MTLEVGSHIGPYRIIAPVAEGGMGHVFRAIDSRIGRNVAIKVLPRSFAADPERLRRFEQEARAAGMLNHPNLLTLFEFGQHEGAPFMVAELLEGETLRSVLGRGAIRVKQAVEYAMEICDGLAAAHERGVIHRDLKPENIFITNDDRVKILDFGLAKLLPEGLGQHDATAEYGDTDTSSGMVLGTAGYMAPEQVRGQAVDGRADIFSFGAILYEMLTGVRAFRKESPVETMNAILSDEPTPLTVLAPSVPQALERVTARCLQKKPEQRFQSARDVEFTLESFTTSSSTEIMRPPRLRVPWRLQPFVFAIAGALAMFAIGYAIATMRATRRIENPPIVRYLTFSGRDSSPAASSDGRTIAFVSTRDGTSRIWLKQLSGGSEAALTSGPDLFPRFSPDASTLLFTRLEGERTALWRVAVVGGQPRRLIVGARDADYSPDGREIVFLRRVDARPQEAWDLWIASADGSNARRILGTNDRQLHSPRWSPDGKEIALIAVGDQITARILLLSPDGKSQRFVQPAQPRGVLSSVAWAASGTVVYSMSDVSAAQSRGAGGSLYAHDVRRGKTRKLLSLPVTGTFVDASGGKIVLDFNSSNQNLRESPIGASASEGRWLTHGRSSDRQPAYSVDGSTIVFSSDRGGNLDLWTISRQTSAIARLTDDPADDWDPAFTPDGKQLLWSSNRAGHFEIWQAEADGSDARQLSLDGADAENPTATADGAWIVYTSFNPSKRGLWKMRRDGSEASRIISGRCLNPEVSPDGQYVAYHTDELYVSAEIRVARIADGAVTPFAASVRLPFGTSIGRTRWMPDGKGVAFIGPDERGRIGVYAQAFDPTRNLPETRRALAGFDRDDPSESFGIARDGSSMTVSLLDQLSGLMIVEGTELK